MIIKKLALLALPTVLLAFSVLAAELDASQSISIDALPANDPTVATVRAYEREISVLKAQLAKQEALNALEESRLKGQNLSVPQPQQTPLAPTSLNAGQRSQPPREVVANARLKEVWSEPKMKTLRAAAEYNSRRIVVQAGDQWPGSPHRVKNVTSRGVELDNNQVIQVGGSL